MTRHPAEHLTTPAPGSTTVLGADPDADAAPEAEATARTGSPTAAPAEPRPKPKLLDLSLTQLVGGSLAAATAAALGSRLGVVGTITGAAVLSIVSAIAANVYTNSMARARDAVVVVRSRRLADGRVVQVATEKVATRDRSRPSWWRRLDRATWRRLLLMAAAVFAVAAVVITLLQLTTGARVTGTDIGARTSVGRVSSPGDSPGGSSGGPTATRTAPVSPTGTPTTSGASAGSTGNPAPASPGHGASVSSSTTPVPSATTPTSRPPTTSATPGATGALGAPGAATATPAAPTAG